MHRWFFLMSAAVQHHDFNRGPTFFRRGQSDFFAVTSLPMRKEETIRERPENCVLEINPACWHGWVHR